MPLPLSRDSILAEFRPGCRDSLWRSELCNKGKRQVKVTGNTLTAARASRVPGSPAHSDAACACALFWFLGVGSFLFWGAPIETCPSLHQRQNGCPRDAQNYPAHTVVHTNSGGWWYERTLENRMIARRNEHRDLPAMNGIIGPAVWYGFPRIFHQAGFSPTCVTLCHP